MTRLAALFFLIITVIAPAVAQDAEALAAEVKRAMGENDLTSVTANLRLMSDTDPRFYRNNNYDYLLARALELNGDPAAAIAVYQQVVGRDSLLKEYALFRLSQNARFSGVLWLERTYLNELIAYFPDSLLAAGASARLARSNFESGNYETAISLINAAAVPLRRGRSRTAADTAHERSDMLLMARSYMHLGDLAAARDLFARLLDDTPNASQPDDHTVEAVRALDRIDAAEFPSDPFGRLGVDEHLARGSVYQFHRQFFDARQHYRAIIEKYPESSFVPGAIFEVGRGFALSADHTEAVKWFERLVEQFPDDPIKADALLQAASAYSRVAKYREAIARYERIINEFPDDKRVDRAYLNIVDVLRDLGAETEALGWTAKTQQAFKGRLPEAVAAFAEARIFLARSDWANSELRLEKLREFANLGASSVPGGTTASEVTFLRGYVREQLRNYSGAIDIYLSIPDGRNEYYGGVATARLRALAENPEAMHAVDKKRAELAVSIDAKEPETRRYGAQALLRLSRAGVDEGRLLPIIRAAYAELPDYKRVPEFRFIELGRRQLLKAQQVTDTDRHAAIAEELIFLGLGAEAADELEFAWTAAGREITQDERFTLAVLSAQGGRGERAAAFIGPFWRSMPQDYHEQLIPAVQKELLYPAPYSKFVVDSATRSGVDPRFLLAIMRQESGFRPYARSEAAARGLMQFISPTAQQVAGELGLEPFHDDDLYDPPTSILFGSRYVSDLFGQFPDQPAAVAGGYNGGPDNMKRWLGRSKSNAPELYVPEIAYAQTKDYVQKVMANYRMYQAIYDTGLTPK